MSGIFLSPRLLAVIIAVIVIIAAVSFFVLPDRLSPAGSPAGGEPAGTGPAPISTDQRDRTAPSFPEGTPEETSRTLIMTTTPGCPQGLVLCSGFCRDISTDEQSCGGCGAGCTVNQVCSNGRCIAVQGYSGLSAPVTMSLPTTAAVSLVVSPPLPTTAGCPAGSTLCYGSCVNLLTDNGNCGRCNNRCAEGQKCEGGTCVFSYCLKPLTLCNGVCRNLFTDMNNCGSCGRSCPSSVSHGTVSCQNGACKITCEMDYGNCDGVITNGCESYLRFDANNCGACGVKCPSGYVCEADTSGCHPRIIK